MTRDSPPRVEGPPFELREERRGSGFVLTISGELDIATTGRVDRALADLPAGTSLVAIDLRGLEFMDSSGLRSILLANRRLPAAGIELLLSHPSDVARRVFQVTQTERALPFAPDADFDARIAALG